MLRFGIYVFFLLFTVQSLLAQNSLSGRVVNTDQEPLAFVNLLINGDPLRGQSTDIDGRFSFQELALGDSLLLSYVGYAKQSFSIQAIHFSQEVVIILQEQAYALGAAEVIAGENPAHRIIRRASQMRPTHNPEKRRAYSCKTYNKLVFDWAPDEVGIKGLRERAKKGKLAELRLRRFDELTKTANRQHALLVESLTEREFLKPKHLQETVLHKRVSGFKHPSFVALANSVQPFSCYETHINLLGKKFLNPITEGSTNHYFFDLQDTLYRGADSIFIIAYHPRQGTTFDGLKGVVYIHTNGYAIQSIIGEPAEPGQLKMKIEQRYQFLEQAAGVSGWFPDQLNFELLAAHYPDKFLGVKISGRSYIRAVELAPDLGLRDFGLEGIKTAPNANNRNDSLWEVVRSEALSLREQNTYLYMDSLGERRNLDAFLGVAEILISGLIPLGPFDLELQRLIGFNNHEVVRGGLGIKTSERVFPRFTLGAYGAYGFGDDEWKYGGYTDYKLGMRKEIKVGLSYRNDLEEPGLRKYAIQSSLFSSRNYAFRFDRVESYAGHLEGWFIPYVFLRFSLEESRWKPEYDYRYGEGDSPLGQDFRFTEFRVDFRYSHGERFTKMLGTRVRKTSHAPILQITYAKGFDNWLRGTYDYHRLLVNLEYEYQFKTFGETYFLLEGAWASAGLPYQKLFDTNGLGRNFRILLDDHTFHTMDPYEFLSNRFVEFFFRHNFKSIFGKWKFIQPELSVVHNLTFGALDHPELHQDITFNTLEKGYYETGLILDNLIGINYLNVGTIGLGLGGFYRYGPYARDYWKDNVGVQVTLNFDML